MPGRIEYWERWENKEMEDHVAAAWTHRVLRQLYRGAEDEFHVVVRQSILDDRDPWEVSYYAPDSPGGFEERNFETKEDAMEWARDWMRDHKIEEKMGWMSIAGHDDREYLEERVDKYESDGIETRVVRSDVNPDMWNLEVDVEDFIDAGYRLM